MRSNNFKKYKRKFVPLGVNNNGAVIQRYNIKVKSISRMDMFQKHLPNLSRLTGLIIVIESK